MKKRANLLRAMKRIMTLFVPIVVVFGAAATTVTTAAAMDAALSSQSASPKWPRDFQTESSDTCRIRVILTPKDPGCSSLIADLVLVYEPRATQPSSAIIMSDGERYPVDNPEEGLVDIKGKVFHYRRLRAYER